MTYTYNVNHVESIVLAATIEQEGGFTYRFGAEIPTSGYMVSTIDQEEVYDLNEIIITDVVDEYLMNHNWVLVYDDLYIGAWVDNGKLYLDVSAHVEEEEEAICLGKRNNQLGIFCLDTFETYYL